MLVQRCKSRPAADAAPTFSVVIATYQRGAKLKTTLQSVALQSLQDFEVLIVSDGPAEPELLAVVRAFGPRFRLHELPTRSGSQSGPNNHGWQHARGEFIAYLGHDDIWHPDHLLKLESTFREHPDTTFAISGCLMIGPPGKRDDLTWATGVFHTPDAGLTFFFPPSSVSHRRKPATRIQSWPEPLTNRAPVDSVFLSTAAAAGHLFYSTKCITVFKFNSALRYLSYLLPDDREQSEMLMITQSPNQLDQFIAERLKVARTQGMFMELTHPNPEGFEPGAIVRGYEKVRGISLPTVEKLESKRRVAIPPDALGFDWYASEGREPNVWKWSGPSNRPRIAIPFVSSDKVRVTMSIARFISDEVRDTLTIIANDQIVTHSLVTTGDGTSHQIVFNTRLTNHRGSVFELVMPFTRSPAALNLAKDTRELGLCLLEIQLQPITQPRFPAQIFRFACSHKS